jgi:hypothetical protein
VWLASIGSGLLIVALAVAVNYGGTDDIDAIRPILTVLTVILVTLLALVVGVLCTLTTSWASDRLLADRFNRLQSILILIGSCGIGLFLGGLVGLLAA